MLGYLVARGIIGALGVAIAYALVNALALAPLAEVSAALAGAR